MTIYKITNKINNKIYIGKDTTDDKNYYGSGNLIKMAIKKYGKDNFQKEILIFVEDSKLLSELEKYYISFYNSNDLSIGYNLTAGGDGGDTLSNHPDRKMICEKISKNHPKKGRTYEQAFGIEKAKDYKYKLSKNHPKKSIKERTGDKYDEWLENIRKAAKNKEGKSIKENNKWSEEQYQDYLITLKERTKNLWNSLDESTKEKIIIKRRERGKKIRLENINLFIDNLKNNKINKENYTKYVNRIREWKKDLTEIEFNEYIPIQILEKFYSIKK